MASPHQKGEPQFIDNQRYKEIRDIISELRVHKTIKDFYGWMNGLNNLFHEIADWLEETEFNEILEKLKRARKLMQSYAINGFSPFE